MSGVLAVMDAAAEALGTQWCGMADLGGDLEEARVTVAVLIEALQHIAGFTAYQDCDICGEIHNTARAAIARATGAEA